MESVRPASHAHDHPADPSALTRNQQLVLSALERAGSPLGAYALLDELRPHGFKAPLQVYRALDKLLDAGLVHRLESVNSFVACVHPDCHASRNAVFAICDRCGGTQEFTDETISKQLTAWAGVHGFRPTKATIEMKGLCAACAAAA